MKFSKLLLIFMLFQTVLWGNVNEFMTATLLADKLLTKLEQNTPFTIKEGEQFFGPTGSIPSLNVFLFQKLGYLNNAGAQIKTFPKYSPLGELLRMNRNLFIADGEINKVSFFPANELRKDITANTFSIYDKNTIFVYIKMENQKNDIEFVDEKLLRFDYNIIGKFFFTYGFSINGKSILQKLGFFTKKHDKYNYPIIEIHDNVLEKLKLHLEKLEQK